MLNHQVLLVRLPKKGFKDPRTTKLFGFIHQRFTKEAWYPCTGLRGATRWQQQRPTATSAAGEVSGPSPRISSRLGAPPEDA